VAQLDAAPAADRNRVAAALGAAVRTVARQAARV